MRVRFWGVRGSIPCPGAKSWRYGGNSACIELRAGDAGRLIIIDAGSGIRELGNHLLRHDLAKGPIVTQIFLSHTHWDHIMGFPYFTPIYIPGSKMTVYGPVTFEDDPLEEIVGGQMKYRYFPVNMGELRSEIHYERLQETSTLDLGDGLTVTTKFLNHPVTTLGYRFEYGGKLFCACYDTEPFRNLFITDPNHPDYDEAMALEGEEVAAEQNALVEDFFAGADMLVHDAQYTEAEYRLNRVGWGHSSMEYAVAAARRAKVKRLALFHHDPDRGDEELDKLTEIYCQKKSDANPDIFFAREGMVVEL